MRIIRMAHRFLYWLETGFTRPAPGLAWCVGCSWNDGRTYTFPVDSAVPHLKLHAEGEWVKLLFSYPRKENLGEENGPG
jgi:hypothetical protein